MSSICPNSAHLNGWRSCDTNNLSSKVSPVIQSHSRVQWSSSQSSPAITQNSLQFFFLLAAVLKLQKIHLLSRKKTQWSWDLKPGTFQVLYSWTLLPLSHWIYSKYSKGADAILLITAMLKALADSSCLSLSDHWIHYLGYEWNCPVNGVAGLGWIDSTGTLPVDILTLHISCSPRLNYCHLLWKGPQILKSMHTNPGHFCGFMCVCKHEQLDVKHRRERQIHRIQLGI